MNNQYSPFEQADADEPAKRIAWMVESGGSNMDRNGEVDALIVMAIKTKPRGFADLLSDVLVGGKCRQIASEMGREASRVLDGRLQSLRGRNLIHYSEDCWQLGV